MGAERLVVLGGDALAGEFLSDAAQVRRMGGGAVLGPCGVEAELEKVAREGLRFDGLLAAVQDTLVGEMGGEFSGIGVAVVLVVEVDPDAVVAVDGGEPWPGGGGTGTRVVGRCGGWACGLCGLPVRQCSLGEGGSDGPLLGSWRGLGRCALWVVVGACGGERMRVSVMTAGSYVVRAS